MTTTLEISVRLCALMCLSLVILHIRLFFYWLLHLNYIQFHVYTFTNKLNQS